ncbi:MAG: SH3 domain-containing protein [Deltaproteobacteria bacterium]|nr:SH3 domain-containing protein [Deltaproteobacteria bacterium]
MLARTLTLVLLLTTTAAHAETSDEVWTTRATHLRARPGENGAVVGRAAKGAELIVLRERGRWLRVRHGRLVGWVTRAEVEDRVERVRVPGEDGFGDKPVEDAVQATVQFDKVRGFDDPKTRSNVVLDLKKGDRVTVLGRGDDGWILVQPEHGAHGWIPGVTVADSARFAGDPRRAPAQLAAVPMVKPTAAPVHTLGAAAAPTGRLMGALITTAGAETFAMRQTGGTDALATATGKAAAVSAGAKIRIASDLWFGGGADAELGQASLTYSAADATSPSMATRTTTVDARAELGWGSRWHVAARAGYHYGAMAITSDRTEAMLVGEHIGGLTVGVGGGVPIGRVTLSAAVDVMPTGVQAPDELPAGMLYGTAMRAAWARTTIAIRLPAHLVGAISYRGGLASIDLTDGAATPTVATRSDQSHTVTAGLGLRW